MLDTFNRELKGRSRLFRSSTNKESAFLKLQREREIRSDIVGATGCNQCFLKTFLSRVYKIANIYSSVCLAFESKIPDPLFSSVFSQCMLEKVGNWNFDIFLFDRLTNGESDKAALILHFANGATCWIETDTKVKHPPLSSSLRKQPDHPDLPPAQPVRPGGALSAGPGQTLEVPGHGAGGLPQRQPVPQRCARRRRHAGHVLLH